MSNINYKNFADDELLYLANAYNKGLRYNGMIVQAQHICEFYFKHIISQSLLNNDQIMRTHSLRALYAFITNELGKDIKDIKSHVFTIDSYATHTSYPGPNCFIASGEDVETVFDALGKIVKGLQEVFM